MIPHTRFGSFSRGRSGFLNRSQKGIKKGKPLESLEVFLMAEKEGFEPSIPFWGIHDFQSCALGQLRDFSKS